jgi:hypothetical protein
LRSQIHEYTARGISAIFPIACLLLALSWRKVHAFKNISNWTMAFGAVGLVLNIIGLGYVTGNLEWIGALERLIILNGFAWLVILGLYFCHITREEHYTYKSRVFISSLSYGVRMELRDFFGRVLPGTGSGCWFTRTSGTGLTMTATQSVRVTCISRAWLGKAPLRTEVFSRSRTILSG